MIRVLPILAVGLLLFSGGCRESSGADEGGGRGRGRKAEAEEGRSSADADAGRPAIRRPSKLRLLSVTELPGADKSFLLYDPYRYTDRTVVLPAPAYFAATLFDGRRTTSEVALEVELRAGIVGSASEVETLARDLEDALFLDSPRFRELKDRIDGAYAKAKRRPVYGVTKKLTADPEELARLMDGWYALPRGAGRPEADAAPGPDAGGLDEGGGAAPRPRLVAVVAPHIDPRAGGPVYSHAYRAIAEEAADADLFVLLATGHQPLEGSIGLTRKDYDTPFGAIETDQEALDRVAGAIGDGAFRNEWAHRTEHSLELTTTFLAHALRGRRTRPIRALPILVANFGDTEVRGPPPESNPEVRALIRALRAVRREREARGERVVFVAGADLAHRGTRFGDQAASESDAPFLEPADRTFAALVLAGNARAVLDDYRSDGGTRRYCGFAPLYVLSSVVGPSTGEILAHGHHLEEGALVTFVSGTMRR